MSLLRTITSVKSTLDEPSHMSVTITKSLECLNYLGPFPTETKNEQIFLVNFDFVEF